MTLTEFLLARIVEDEGDARSLGGELRGTAWQGGAGTPERVLAECEAKRRIVDWAAPERGRERVPTDRPGVYDVRKIRYVNEDAEGLLELLALPYADHPDYREEWKL